MNLQAHKLGADMSVHRFGGAWTDKKLQALRDYLAQYRLIFTTNEKAKYFKTIYLDGFAGTGARQDTTKKASEEQLSLSPEMDADAQAYKRGSASVALGLASPFDEYVFVEKMMKRAEELAMLIKTDFPELESRCQVFRGEANEFLRDWCANSDWRKQRAVVFLDPYGMSVDWETISRIAGTQAIDMWLLFPLGTGINRLLTRGALPPKDWAEKVTRILGVAQDVWQPAFYAQSTQKNLFGEEDQKAIKVADFKSMGDFFIARLRTIFAGVAPHAMPLFNSMNNPMYLLCFAAGNPKGARPAVKIADHLLKGI
jgi:three-Cys-motif partner protein